MKLISWSATDLQSPCSTYPLTVNLPLSGSLGDVIRAIPEAFHVNLTGGTTRLRKPAFLSGTMLPGFACTSDRD